MRKGNLKLIACGGMAILAILLWMIIRGSPEPDYQGKPLSFWLHKYMMPPGVGLGPNERIEPDRAVRAIGTNAIPILLEMLHARDSAMKREAIQLSRKQRLLKLNLWNAMEKRFMASMAFGALGESASNAVPALLSMLDSASSNSTSQFHSDSLGVRYSIINSLGSIGPPARSAVPSLIHSATNRNDPARGNSMSALGYIHADPSLAIPVLNQMFHETNLDAQLSAMSGLASYGTNPEVPVSEIVLLMRKDQLTKKRYYAASALARIYEKPEWEKFSYLIVKKKELGIPLQIINDLGDMGKGAALAVPALVTLLSDEDESVRISATNALRKIDPETAAKAGVRWDWNGKSF